MPAAEPAFIVGNPRKRDLAQYLTPPAVAAYLASLLDLEGRTRVKLLDAGAGEGILARAVEERMRRETEDAELQVVAYELDPAMATTFRMLWNPGVRAQLDLREADYLSTVSSREDARYTHAILNPPYKRLPSRHPLASELRRAGVWTPNYYSVFLSLAISQLDHGGQLVAIVPRSFCNGVHFRQMRRRIVETCAIERLQVIESRRDAFKDDGVLQENLIVVLRKGRTQGHVEIVRSSDARFTDLDIEHVDFEQVVDPGDESYVFRVGAVSSPPDGVAFRETDLRVFTGAVVDFRNQLHLRQHLVGDSVPLIHAHHITTGGFDWPGTRGGKPIALARTSQTEALMLPPGHYVAIRRFSSKEQPRRVVAAHVAAVGGSYGRGVAFENHLNVIAGSSTEGLSEEEAQLLASYLNSDQVDRVMRTILGSTQVNASDLRLLTFPGALERGRVQRRGDP